MIYNFQLLSSSLRRQELPSIQANVHSPLITSSFLAILWTRLDPAKTSAILQMDAPTNLSDLRQFLGMANQLGKFSPRLAEITQPLRELLSSKKTWLWGPDQQYTFSELSRPTILTLYNLEAPTKVLADASSYGTGAVLLQYNEGQWKPVAYASCSMSDSERRYAQIKKEVLATTCTCEKFSAYILGQHFEIESDHKLLIPLLNSKALDNLPPEFYVFGCN